MAKINDLTVDVTANLTVSDETANRCLRLLEMWQADNPDKSIMADSEYGYIRFYIQSAKTKAERLREMMNEIEKKRKQDAQPPHEVEREDNP